MLGSRVRSQGRRRWAGAVLALAVVAGGCQSSAEPPPMTGTPTPSVSPSPTPTAPTLPAEARGTSTASAKAFVRHWIDVLNYAMRTGDTTGLDSLSAADCESCLALIRNIEKPYAAGGYIKTRGWVLQSIFPVPLQPKKRPMFDLGLYLSREVVLERAGGTERTAAGGKQPMTIHLVWTNSAWQVTRLDLPS